MSRDIRGTTKGSYKAALLVCGLALTSQYAFAQQGEPPASQDTGETDDDGF